MLLKLRFGNDIKQPRVGKSLQTRRSDRNELGTNIPEFVVALFMLVFCGLIPLCNLIGFGTSYVSVQELTRETTRRASMAESKTMAKACVNSIESSLKQPLLCALHTINLHETVATVAVVDEKGERSEYKAFETLPARVRAGRDKFRFYYRLKVCCEIMPIFNLSGIPFIGQVPVIGGATVVNSFSEVPVEYPRALDR